MNNFFSTDNWIFQKLSQAADLAILSVLWIVCCMTIVLIIPGTAALYHTTYKVVRREYGSLLGEFWQSLKSNCKQGIVLSLLALAGAALVRFSFRFSTLAGLAEEIRFLYYCVGWITTVVLCLIMVYICPLLSRFHMPLGKLVGNAFLLGIRHIPTTLLCAAIVLSAGTGVYLLYILLLFLPALACFAISFPMEKVLIQYMGDPPQDPADPDRWYWE